MNYDFKTEEEFRDFILESLQSGRYNQELRNITKGINSISNSNNSWDWIEEGKLYVVKNKAETLYIIFPILRSQGALWYIPLYKMSANGADFTYEAGENLYLNKSEPVGLWEMRGGSWVKEYILLDSHSSGFINWKKNPFENK